MSLTTIAIFAGLVEAYVAWVHVPAGNFVRVSRLESAPPWRRWSAGSGPRFKERMEVELPRAEKAAQLELTITPDEYRIELLTFSRVADLGHLVIDESVRWTPKGGLGVYRLELPEEARRVGIEAIHIEPKDGEKVHELGGIGLRSGK